MIRFAVAARAWRALRTGTGARWPGAYLAKYYPCLAGGGRLVHCALEIFTIHIALEIFM